MGVYTTYGGQNRVSWVWSSGFISPGTEEPSGLYYNSTEITRLELDPERRVFPRLDDIGISGCLGFFWIRDLVEGRSLGPGCCTQLSTGEIRCLRACTDGSDVPINGLCTIG